MLPYTFKNERVCDLVGKVIYNFEHQHPIEQKLLTNLQKLLIANKYSILSKEK